MIYLTIKLILKSSLISNDYHRQSHDGRQRSRGYISRRYEFEPSQKNPSSISAINDKQLASDLNALMHCSVHGKICAQNHLRW